MKRVTGGGLPARLWQKIMVKAHQGIPVRPLYGTDVPAPVAASAPAWVDPDKQTQTVAQDGSFWDRLKNVIGIR